MRGRLLAGTLAACLIGSSAGATPPPFGGIRNLHIEVDVNPRTGSPNQWVSSGAFVDSGTVRHGQVASFRGATAMATDSPEGANGSFTWTFVLAFTGPLDGGRHPAQGTWTIIGGTGAYEGMSGRGTISGWWDEASGDVHNEFDGTVDCPNCP